MSLGSIYPPNTYKLYNLFTLSVAPRAAMLLSIVVSGLEGFSSVPSAAMVLCMRGTSVILIASLIPTGPLYI